MNKTSLLELAKKLNILVETAWEQKKSWKKPSKTPSQGTKRLCLVEIPPLVWCVWMNLESRIFIDQKIYDQKLMEDMMRKLAWGELQKKSWWIVTRWLIRKQVRCWIQKLISHIGKTNFDPILESLWTIKSHAVRWRDFIF